MRDFLAATRDRVVVFDGGMGATLEQFDLSLEDDYKLPGRCHEALILNRPDVIEGVHTSMIEAGFVRQAAWQLLHRVGSVDEAFDLIEG